jgi:hypothetical protein
VDLPEAPIRAELILRNLIASHQQGNGVAPSKEAFTLVMNAWASSNNKNSNAPEKVEALLDLMKQIAATSNQLQITSIPYTVWIEAGETVTRQRSQPQEQQKCADNALGILTQMKQDGVTPTAPTYNALIMALLVTSPANAIFYF